MSTKPKGFNRENLRPLRLPIKARDSHVNSNVKPAHTPLEPKPQVKTRNLNPYPKCKPLAKAPDSRLKTKPLPLAPNRKPIMKIHKKTINTVRKPTPSFPQVAIDATKLRKTTSQKARPLLLKDNRPFKMGVSGRLGKTPTIDHPKATWGAGTP